MSGEPVPEMDLTSLAERLRDAGHLAPALRRALATACCSRQPVRSVNQLAVLTGCNRRTLGLQWRKAIGGTGLRLQDFVHWVLLLRAVRCKRPDCPWSVAAEGVGVHAHTLSRHARQLAGCSVHDLSACSEAEIVRLFEVRVVGMLLASPTPAARGEHREMAEAAPQNAVVPWIAHMWGSRAGILLPNSRDDDEASPGR